MDGSSFEELKNEGWVGCSGDVDASSILKDKNGVYVLRYKGDFLHTSYMLEPLNVFDHATFQLMPDEGARIEVWALDRKHAYFSRDLSRKDIQVIPLNLQQANQETFKLDDRYVDTFYRDDNSIYNAQYMNSENSQSFNVSLGVDPQTLNAYAALWKAIILKDKSSYYIGSFINGRISYKKFLDGDAALACLGKNHLCLLSGDKLYYVFDDGSVIENQINTNKLHCVKENILLETVHLEKYNQPGLCFDEQYFYNKERREELYPWDHKKLLPYVSSDDELEQMRLYSLKRLHIERKPLLAENNL